MADREPQENSQALVIGEVVDAIQQQEKASGQPINVNILIQQVSQKSTNPAEIVAQTEKALELVERWEQKRLQAFKDRVAAIIDAKTKDPDEIEKRQNNGVRRRLKHLIGLMAFLAVGGGIAVILMGGPIVVVTALLLVGVVSI